MLRECATNHDNKLIPNILGADDLHATRRLKHLSRVYVMTQEPFICVFISSKQEV